MLHYDEQNISKRIYEFTAKLPWQTLPHFIFLKSLLMNVCKFGLSKLISICCKAG